MPITIDKAIELLARINKSFEIPPDALIQEAVKLGIEALKRLRDHRGEYYFKYDLPLPGETEE